MKIRQSFLMAAAVIVLISFVSLMAEPSPEDAIYLKMVKEFRLNADGRWTFTQSHRLQLNSYFSTNNRYGETFIIYNPEFQVLTVRRNETTMADGKIIKSPANAFNEVLPRYAADAPAYNHLREMVITHTALEIGSIIDLEYEIENESGFLPGMMGDEVLAADSPVRELTVRIRVPDHQKLNYHLYNTAGQPKEASFGGETQYEWTFSDIAAIAPERQQPPAADFAPRLVFSTVSSWQDAFSVLMNQTTFKENPDSPVRSMAISAREKCPDEWDFILKMQNMVAGEMATFAIPTVIAGYRLRSPSDVWASNGGTLLEKTVLLRDLLQYGGVAAHLSLMSVGSVVADDFPVLPSFDKAMLRVTDSRSRSFFMPVDQPAKQDLNYPLVKQTAVILESGKVSLGMIPRIAAENNSAGIRAQLSLDSHKKLTGQINLELTGAAYPWFEFLQNSKSAEKMMQGFSSGSVISGLRIRGMEENNFAAEARLENDHPFREQDSYYFWPIPANPAGMESWHLPAMSLQRVTPLKLPYPLQDETEILLTLPENIMLAMPAVDIQKENACGKLHIKITQEKDRVKILRRIEINRHYLPVDEYANWLELWRVWQAPNYRELILKAR